MAMVIEGLLGLFPDWRIKPVDGMAVTAEVWEEAHEYHRRQQRFHALFAHGAGIVTGLEVIASDPPDSSLYVLPGIAIDPAGQTIIVPRPVAYDLGNEVEGLLYLLLGYREGRPRAKSKAGEDAPLYIRAGFSLIARPDRPDTPMVELARLRREGRDAPLRDALDPMHPGRNEIDLRFRNEVGPRRRRRVTVAVSYLGKVREQVQGRGMGCLARALNRTGDWQVIVDDVLPLSPVVQAYGLVYLVGEGRVELAPAQVDWLRSYVEQGGTLFIECGDEEAGISLSGYVRDMGIALSPLTIGHRLLSDPFLFAAPPPGYVRDGMVLVGEGVVISERNYGRLWQGEGEGREPSRSEIRSAVEWGTNLMDYVVCRRRGNGNVK